jgi:hypothetical protein
MPELHRRNAEFVSIIWRKLILSVNLSQCPLGIMEDDGIAHAWRNILAPLALQTVFLQIGCELAKVASRRYLNDNRCKWPGTVARSRPMHS